MLSSISTIADHVIIYRRSIVDHNIMYSRFIVDYVIICSKSVVDYFIIHYHNHATKILLLCNVLSGRVHSGKVSHLEGSTWWSEHHWQQSMSCSVTSRVRGPGEQMIVVIFLAPVALSLIVYYSYFNELQCHFPRARPR